LIIYRKEKWTRKHKEMALPTSGDVADRVFMMAMREYGAVAMF
jgi:hypothetical protein